MTGGPRLASPPVGRADAAPSAHLTRGINLTNWFRFPPSRDPAALNSYLQTS
jgi:hypothetical protein